MLVTRRVSFRAMAVLAGTILLASAGAARAGVSGVQSGGTWNKAIQIPGTGNHSGAFAQSVSCPSPGNCGAGGYYIDRFGAYQAFVGTEVAGRWLRAIEVPGTAKLNVGGFGQTAEVSCPTPGNCAADGNYSPRLYQAGMFLDNQVSGQWHGALGVNGQVAVVDSGILSLSSLSCASPGNCAVGGNVHTRGGYRAFVIDEANGHWGQPLRLSGAGVGTGYYAEVDGISCSSAGNCTATGFDRHVHRADRLFAVSEQAGLWGLAVTIPMSTEINAVDEGPTLNSMSCASLGNCAAVGSYEYSIQSTVYSQPFVVTETGGVWGQAIDVPGLTRPSNGGTGESDSVSCAPPGTCTAGGSYTDSFGNHHGFVVSETGGVWGIAEKVSGSVDVTAVSCAAPGECAAGGYSFSARIPKAFVVTETGGLWGSPLPIPGLVALGAGEGAQVSSISCPAAGQCTVIGNYTDRFGSAKTFVASQS